MCNIYSFCIFILLSFFILDDNNLGKSSSSFIFLVSNCCFVIDFFIDSKYSSASNCAFDFISVAGSSILSNCCFVLDFFIDFKYSSASNCAFVFEIASTSDIFSFLLNGDRKENIEPSFSSTLVGSIY